MILASDSLPRRLHPFGKIHMDLGHAGLINLIFIVGEVVHLDLHGRREVRSKFPHEPRWHSLDDVEL